MSESSIEELIRGVSGRHGAIALLRRLGFVRPPVRADHLRRELDARAAFAAGGAVLRGWLIESRAACDVASVRDVARVVRALDPLAFHCFVLADRAYARFALACEGPDRALRHVVLERDALRASDVDIIAEMVPRPGEAESAVALRFLRALDRSRVSQRFFRDVAGIRDQVSRAWTGIPRDHRQHRDALALLLLSRLLFLYFLQRRGQLAGDTEYLPNLLRGHRRDDARRAVKPSFYRSTLRALFFGVLNRRPEKRTTAARALGELPYLNGGLFEEHRLELGHPRLDIPDAALARVFTGLLEKYRFAPAESAETHADDGPGIDPEMPGRIFEGLMPGEERGRTGAFYSPPAIVEHVVAEALAAHLSAHCNVRPDDIAPLLQRRFTGNVSEREPVAHVAAASIAEREAPAHRALVARVLSSLRVLDPACGSGAFLVGALLWIARARVALGGDAAEVRRDVVARTLHGVDVLEDAALICSLRLWLALIPRARTESIPPLPNLDRRVRQGDALIDPFDLRAVSSGHMLDVPLAFQLYVIAERGYARFAVACDGPDRALRQLYNHFNSFSSTSSVGRITRPLIHVVGVPDTPARCPSEIPSLILGNESTGNCTHAANSLLSGTPTSSAKLSQATEPNVRCPASNARYIGQKRSCRSAHSAATAAGMACRWDGRGKC